MSTLLALTLLLAGGAEPRPAPSSPLTLAAPGQTFLFLAGENREVRQGGQVLPLGSVYGKVFTFRRAEGSELVFGVEGLKGEVRTRGLPASLAPTVEDVAVAALRRQFASGRAWLYGGGVLTCRPEKGSYVNFVGPPTQALPVLNIWRVARPTGIELSNKNGLGPYRQVREPLVVRLGRPAPYTFRDAGTSGSAEHLLALGNSPACGQVTELYADEVHLNRRLSAAPPPAGVQASGQGTFVGLSKLSALWRLGAPDEPGGPINTVLAADEWVWPGAPGRGDFVLHFREGRVERVEVPSAGP